ncbi:Uncharacterised protein [Mycobacteroides abscessus subsp. massiliense]|uniref:hypothetical protein n=1 Tax=Mycobacteroides abscessus TaxID=36809 RepID=UPI0009CE3DD3|nr:hypothetical protein [Mycobacteroides abscessus]SKH53417.1 Uncharacterised protein [Mycobacteroides abscessus subsp. massiliense]SKH84177.1 Uncharacterised protein [Mycobacteroides abscessus subsp. massiliense]SKK33724.1 Uncharacterised protein [Mycobacteroides abscessus subsp. massiliense]SKK45659.1 Uncharacterised protein [Mycobacteroides abscessus subsp. massiliense]SKL87280.1 Uncharacterised protein [Mycobacteroides abscessus subsp. massiliense]
MNFTIMRNAAITVGSIALVFALVALSDGHRGDFIVAMVVFAVAIWGDLRINRRGRYRDRSAVLLFIAAIAIVVTGMFAAPAAYAAGIGVGA